MSTNENGVSPVPTQTDVNSYNEVAQARLKELRLMRETIPHFCTPAFPNETQRVSIAAAIPAEFIELTAVAVTNEKSLVRADGATPEEVRDFMKYGEAFLPLADEFEALAQFLRHSVAIARNKAGREALTTYALAQRLAQRPDKLHLAPYVADMRRALGRVRKQTPEALARKAAKKVEKEAAKAAKAAAKVTVQTP